MSDHNRLSRRDMVKTLETIPLAVLVPTLARAEIGGPLYFSCREDNDLYRVAKASVVACLRYDRAEEVVARAPQGPGLLVLAEHYPKKTTTIDGRVYQEAARKKLRLYVEFSSSVSDLSVGAPQHVGYQYYHNNLDRAVGDTDAFGPALKRMRILALHDCICVPVESQAVRLLGQKEGAVFNVLYTNS